MEAEGRAQPTEAPLPSATTAAAGRRAEVQRLTDKLAKRFPDVGFMVVVSIMTWRYEQSRPTLRPPALPLQRGLRGGTRSWPRGLCLGREHGISCTQLHPCLVGGKHQCHPVARDAGRSCHRAAGRAGRRQAGRGAGGLYAAWRHHCLAV